MKKKIASVVLGTAMAASMLAGCGSSQKAAETTAAPAAESTEAAAETKAEEASEAGSEAAASDYEFKDTITLICPVKAGGDTDRNTRLLAQYMQKYAGVNVVVKNVDGGATVMGMQECLDAKPDGNTLEDLLKASQAAPDSIEYGGKIGASNQICGIAMNKEWNAGLKFVDVGNNAAKMTALLGEQTDVINISYALATDYFSTGEFIPLCLLGAEKNELLPDVPMASDYGLADLDFSKFFWVGTSPDVPDETVDALADVIEKVCEDPEFVSTVEGYYLTVNFMKGKEAQDFANGMYENGLLPYKDAFLAQQ